MRSRRLASLGAAITLTFVLAPQSLADTVVDNGDWNTAGRIGVIESSDVDPTHFVDEVAVTVEIATAPSISDRAPALYTLSDLLFSGVINWGGYRFTYYSESVLPGGGLAIPGRHVNDGGFVADADGYIVLANDAPKGTVFETPFGNLGKVYDRGTSGNHLDVYTR
ncbi:hypothetical protein FYJ24_04125 [Actinomycetaceae bacterium WB03_NA08]|uniref:Uncharacterized protein n=1 Tax=Scrofimicrobium canadense TaxID=2652290 RepID=A0A6N7VQD8_9ACTO|nr:hypothetical protein [Scrofimicrobium canadense]MSS83964.1 hypothetical protein [Scrofimicrobium canadense]